MLFNNAGLGAVKGQTGTSWAGLDVWHKIFEVNVFGVVNVQQTFVPVSAGTRRFGATRTDGAWGLAVDGAPGEPVDHHQHRVQAGHHEPTVRRDSTGAVGPADLGIFPAETRPTTPRRPPSDRSRRASPGNCANRRRRTSPRTCSCTLRRSAPCFPLPAPRAELTRTRSPHSPGWTHTGYGGDVGDTVPEHKPKPAGAWSPEETVLFALDRVRSGDFYILCPDNDTRPEVDHLRIMWAAGGAYREMSPAAFLLFVLSPPFFLCARRAFR
jgi:hypothetical protein